MAYTVEFELRATAALVKLPRRDRERIVARCENLSVEPRPDGVVKLTGGGGYRIRSGDYRIVYLINDSVRVVSITKIGHRRDIYRR